jgi:hypothetical protein
MRSTLFKGTDCCSSRLALCGTMWHTIILAIDLMTNELLVLPLLYSWSSCGLIDVHSTHGKHNPMRG